MEPRCLTPAEVADLLDVTPQWIRRECARGRFPGATQVNGRGDWRIPPRAVRLHQVPGHKYGPAAEFIATTKLLMELRNVPPARGTEAFNMLLSDVRLLRDELDQFEEWALGQGHA